MLNVVLALADNPIMVPADRRLLIVACSGSKAEVKEAVPAHRLYTGAYWGVLNSACPPESHRRPDVIVLSAEHGFIDERLPIATYDRFMDKTREAELANDPKQAATLGTLMRGEYEEVFVAAGREYRHVIVSAGADHLPWGQVEFSAGGIGQQKSQLKTWLKRSAIRDDDAWVEAQRLKAAVQESPSSFSIGWAYMSDADFLEAARLILAGCSEAAQSVAWRAFQERAKHG